MKTDTGVAASSADEADAWQFMSPSRTVEFIGVVGLQIRSLVSDHAHRHLGDAYKQAQALKWVRVSVYATDGLLCFEHDPKQPLSAPQMLALRELESLHGLRPYDEVKQSMVEAIRPQWATRFPATRGFRP